jgi:predicted ATPase
LQLPHSFDCDQLRAQKFLTNQLSLSWYHRYLKKPIVWLHGPVGSGKSYVMQQVINHHSPLFKRKHCLEWSSWLQQQLKTHQGHANPMSQIYRRFMCQINGIVIDDLMMDNIATFQLVARWALLLYKMKKNVWITANALPNQLSNDLVIKNVNKELSKTLEQKILGVRFRGLVDYRLAHNPVRYLYGQGDRLSMQQIFDQRAGHGKYQSSYPVGRCQLPCIAQKPDLIWCQMSDLCQPPMSRFEYASFQDLSCILISDDLDRWSLNVCYNFVYLLDHCFDTRIKLGFQTEKDDQVIQQILTSSYRFGERAYSRLIELCSDSSGNISTE